MAPGTEFAHDFCAGIGPLQLGVVLVFVAIGFTDRTAFIIESNFSLVHT